MANETATTETTAVKTTNMAAAEKVSLRRSVSTAAAHVLRTKEAAPDLPLRGLYNDPSRP